jgi:hypothetical protein
MNPDPRKELYQKTLTQLRPALERVVADAAFRARLEQAPLAVLDELGIPLDDGTRAELGGKRFSEFWAARRRAVEGPARARPLADDELGDDELEAVAGGISSELAMGLLDFAPPYIPVMPDVPAFGAGKFRK